MALTEKKTRTVWTIYEKWDFVEAPLGSGMSITEYCRDRAQYGQNLDWRRVLSSEPGSAVASATVHKPINNVRQPEIPQQKMELAGNDSPPLY